MRRALKGLRRENEELRVRRASSDWHSLSDGARRTRLTYIHTKYKNALKPTCVLLLVRRRGWRLLSGVRRRPHTDDALLTRVNGHRRRLSSLLLVHDVYRSSGDNRSRTPSVRRRIRVGIRHGVSSKLRARATLASLDVETGHRADDDGETSRRCAGDDDDLSLR